MSKDDIIEQARQYIKNNLDKDATIKCVVSIIDDLSQELEKERTTSSDIKDFNTLSTVMLILKEMI